MHYEADIKYINQYWWTQKEKHVTWRHFRVRAMRFTSLECILSIWMKLCKTCSYTLITLRQVCHIYISYIVYIYHVIFKWISSPLWFIVSWNDDWIGRFWANVNESKHPSNIYKPSRVKYWCITLSETSRHSFNSGEINCALHVRCGKTQTVWTMKPWVLQRYGPYHHGSHSKTATM